MKRVLFLLIILMSYGYLSAQSGNIDFVQKKKTDNGYTVYFEVVNLSSDEQLESILSDFKHLSDINYVRHFKSGMGGERFQLQINESVTANDIKEILISNNCDYDYRTIIQDGVNIEHQSQAVSTNDRSAKSYSNPDMPQYTSTGNKTQDDENYRVAKEQWIKENPEQYESMLKEIEIKSE